jgi:hypothetical protein
MVGKTDQKLVDYRKYALKTYLQNLVSDPKLQIIPILKDFLAVNE